MTLLAARYASISSVWSGIRRYARASPSPLGRLRLAAPLAEVAERPRPLDRFARPLRAVAPLARAAAVLRFLDVPPCPAVASACWSPLSASVTACSGAGISSTSRVAHFFGVTDYVSNDVPRPAKAVLPPAQTLDPRHPTHGGAGEWARWTPKAAAAAETGLDSQRTDVGAAIAKALRAAGLMR